MRRKVRYSPLAAAQLSEIEADPASPGLFRQIRKALGQLELNPACPGLHSHEFSSLPGAKGEKVFEADAQNNAPGAYRIFWLYVPDLVEGGQRIPVLTIIAITPHPSAIGVGRIPA